MLSYTELTHRAAYKHRLIEKQQDRAQELLDELELLNSVKEPS